MMRESIILAGLLAGLAFPAAAQNILPTPPGYADPNENKVFVTGEGEVTVFPDKIRAVIGTNARNADRKAASEENRRLADTVRKAIIEAGIPESGLRTHMNRLQPVYEYPNNSVPKLVGYEASSAVEFTTTDAAVAGIAIDASVDAGATNVSGPYFEVSNPKEAMAEARKMAMEDAISRAKALAEAGGFGLGEVVTVTDNGSSVSGGPQPMMMMAKAADMAESAPSTQIDTGEETVTANVGVVLRIVPGDLSR